MPWSRTATATAVSLAATEMLTGLAFAVFQGVQDEVAQDPVDPAVVHLHHDARLPGR